MHLIPTMLILWGVVVTTMIALLVFNATCCDCEQTRASANEDNTQKSRRERILIRARRVHPYIRAFGNLSALMTLGLAGVASWAAFESLIR